MHPKKEASYKKTLLEKDANLRRWYNNLKQGSIITAEVGLRRIGRACKLFDTTPQKLAKMSVKQATDFLVDLVAELDSQDKQPKYITHFVKVMKSFFSYNGIKVTEKIKVSEYAKKPSKVAQEQSPSPEQLKRVLNAADQKQKVESSLISFAGSRLESIGDYLGNDGLKLRDLPELVVNYSARTIEFTKVPARIIIRPNLSKAGHQYFTFMPEEGCQYIKEVLEFRMASGEKLTPDSPLVTSLKWLERSIQGKSVGHITSRKVGSSIKTAIKKAGFDWRPYILRTYFDYRLSMAEADGLIIKDWRVFWMGDTGDIEAVYTVNKAKLPEDLIEKMRESFAKAAEKYLVTASSKEVMSKDAVLATFNRQFLTMSGYSDPEIEKLGDLSKLAAEDMQELIKRKSMEALGLNANNRQKVIPLPDVKNWIGQGWEYVSILPNDEAIIRLPR